MPRESSAIPEDDVVGLRVNPIACLGVQPLLHIVSQRMTNDHEEEVIERLSGGNSGFEIVRVGNTVRRPVQPWSPNVDAVLLHLEAVGFEGAPRALGYDTLGRQVLTFVPGHADSSPRDLDLPSLRGVGRLIRDLHDALSSFTSPNEARWNGAIIPDKQDLICHNDLAPWNFVRGSSCSAFIDWDGVGPASRLWDLAYAIHGFVPLSPHSGLDDQMAATRLTALVNGYGLSDEQRSSLVQLLVPRIHSMYELLLNGHLHTVEPWAHLWREGHGEVWREDAAYTEERALLWSRSLY